MASAKKCDICGKYYDVPQAYEDLLWDEGRNTSMIRVLRRTPSDVKIQHDTMQFDACEECLQDVLDYILTKKADSKLNTGR